jgi:solute carrier family 25 (mitochondrial aspartate/glutamate transporter), member 12/13
VQTSRPEGLKGMYRRSYPFVLGFVPQRSIQLAMYYSLDEKYGDLRSPWNCLVQSLCGALSGFVQGIVANSSEAKKINMQLQRASEWRHRAPSLNFSFPPRWWEWKILWFGAFRGMQPTLLREVPFSAVFFPTYSYIQEDLTGRHDGTHWSHALLAGGVGAIPASLLTMPADVVNTRLQATQRMGDIKYTGIIACTKSILKHEGYTALFKGGTLRTLRLVPVLGLTMTVYTELPFVFGLFHQESKITTEKDDYRTMYPTRGIGNKTEDIESLLQFMGVIAKSSEDKKKK